MEKLLIVDGSNLLFQMFFGMPARIVNREGKAIHGVVGFVGALITIIGMTNPTHLVVIFDGEHKSSRTELLADYKANRVDYTNVAENENPFSQLEDIRRALNYLCIRHAEAEELEADDVIAGYALACRDAMEVVISSFDSDFSSSSASVSGFCATAASAPSCVTLPMSRRNTVFCLINTRISRRLRAIRRTISKAPKRWALKQRQL